jgi:hypothetical protein
VVGRILACEDEEAHTERLSGKKDFCESWGFEVLGQEISNLGEELEVCCRVGELFDQLLPLKWVKIL